MRLAAALLVGLLAACAPRGDIVMLPEAGAVGQVQPVYFATMRGASEDPDRIFDGARSEDISYGRIDISVPPDREQGAVAYPDRAEPDPETEFLAIDRHSYDGSGAFRAALSRELAARRDDGRDVVIFVHGFNATFGEGMFRMAQLMQDLQIPGIGVHYSWPSAGNPLGYSHDRDSQLFARDGLEALIADIHAAGARDVVIVAHSMGALMTMEVLRQIEIARPGTAHRTVDGVVLFSPDIDVDLFRAQALRIGKLPQPFIIFTSRRDAALALAARLTGQRERLGNISDVAQVADLDVTILDVSNFSDGTRHLTAATSPSLLRLLSAMGQVSDAFAGDQAGRTGLLPGTILTMQNATQIILEPAAPQRR